MRFQSYFNTAVIILSRYNGELPLVHFLKQYFSQQKKHGSKDRKFITHLCYVYFRLGHALKEESIENRLKIALFLCNETVGDWSILFEESWLIHWKKEFDMRVRFIQTQFPAFSIDTVFPFSDELSDGIEKEKFILAHFIQPDLFLRIRPGKEKVIQQKLTEHQIPFHHLTPNCLVLPNASKIDTILEIDKEVVIQDYSSQRIAEFLQPQTPNPKPQTNLWDCCAASGGKSLLAIDHLTNIRLTVSDLRPGILQNLKIRFEKAGIKNYQSFIADLTDSKFITSKILQNANFNLVLCDAPCSGSGTWSRTPEQLSFFSTQKIFEYAKMQIKILKNIIPFIAPNGYLLYITCSVFKKENEEVVSFITNNSNLELCKMELLKGYDMKADSMFAALFRRKEG